MKIKFTDGYNKKTSSNQQDIDVSGSCVITDYDPRTKKPSQKDDLTVSVDKGKATINGTVFQEDSAEVNFNENKYSIFIELAKMDGDGSNLTMTDLEKAHEQEETFKAEIGATEIKYDRRAGVMTIEFGKEVLRIDFKTWWERWGFVEDSSKLTVEGTSEIKAEEPTSEPIKKTKKVPTNNEVSRKDDSYGAFLYALATQESSNKQWKMSLQNKYHGKKLGYAGSYQIGEAALIDLGIYEKKPDKIINGQKFYNNNWKGKFTGNPGYNITSLDDFLDHQEKQDAVMFALLKKNWDLIHSNEYNLDRYVGDTINGQIITESGLLAGAHLLGVDKLKIYLEHNGQPYYVEGIEGPIISDNTDGNNTPISKYISDFADFDVSNITGVPKGTRAAKIIYKDETYEIVKGDNLWNIAKKKGTTVERIIKANKDTDLTNKTKLRIGQIIIVPVAYNNTTGTPSV